VDHVKSHQSSSDNVGPEDSFYSIGNSIHSEVNCVPFSDPQNAHLSITVIVSNPKVEGDVAIE